MLNSIKSALYLDYPELYTLKAIVTSVGNSKIKNINYHWVQLNSTIFHPQGGGQPCDKGTINGEKVEFVNKFVTGKINEFEIQHCFSKEHSFKVKDEVELVVDKSLRFLHMKMHTGGHLIAHIVEEIFPELKATGGNHFPEDGYMKFKSKTKELPKEDLIKDKISTIIEKTISNKVQTSILETNEGVRSLKIGEYEAVPCGGTHLTNISYLEGITINGVKCNQKESTVTIKYSIKQ